MIGGNTEVVIQVKTASEKNEIGERISTWTEAKKLKGFLDLMSGNANYTSFNTKIAESTNIFICDWQDLSTVDVEKARMLINNSIYDITFIDDPMGLHDHLEIFLKNKGGLNAN